MTATGCSDDCEEWGDGGDSLGWEYSTLVHFDKRRCVEPWSRWTSLAAAAEGDDDEEEGSDHEEIDDDKSVMTSHW